MVVFVLSCFWYVVVIAVPRLVPPCSPCADRSDWRIQELQCCLRGPEWRETVSCADMGETRHAGSVRRCADGRSAHPTG